MVQTAYTVVQLLSLTDALAQHYDVSAAAMNGGKVKADLYLTRSQTYSDPQTQFQQYQSAAAYDDAASAQSWFGGQMRRTLKNLDTQVSVTNQVLSPTIVGLDTKASYENFITPYTCLYAWEVALLWFWSQGTQLSPGNVYCPGGAVGIATVVTLPNGQTFPITTGWQLCHGLVVAGVPSFVADNAGAVPSVNTPLQQGYAPAIPELLITVTMAGSATTTLVFTGTNQSGVVKTWTAAVVNGGGVGVVAGTVLVLTPQTAGDRLRTITGVAVGTGAVTAGAWQMRVQQEVGRPG